MFINHTVCEIMPCRICKKPGHNKRTCPSKVFSETRLTDCEDCPICLTKIEKTNRAITSCNHVFCLSCLATHLREGHSCPMCRTNLLPKPKKDIEGLRERAELYEEGYDEGYNTAMNEERSTDSNAYLAYQNGFEDGMTAANSQIPENNVMQLYYQTVAPSWITNP